MSLDQLDAQKPEFIGDSVAVHFYNAMLAFLSSPKTASDELTQAIEMDASNLFSMYSVAWSTREWGISRWVGRISDTAIRLAPEGWVVPYYIRGNESLITNDLQGGIDAYTRVLASTPGRLVSV